MDFPLKLGREYLLVDRGGVDLDGPAIITVYLPEIRHETLDVVSGSDREGEMMLVKAETGLTLFILLGHCSGESATSEGLASAHLEGF